MENPKSILYTLSTESRLARSQIFEQKRDCLQPMERGITGVSILWNCTELNINTTQNNIRNCKPHWNYPKISKYHKLLGFVKQQYLNLKYKFLQNSTKYRAKPCHHKPLCPPPYDKTRQTKIIFRTVNREPFVSPMNSQSVIGREGKSFHWKQKNITDIEMCTL